MNPRFHTGSAGNIQLCHPASMISTCRPTHSMCWLRRPWFDKTKSTAPNHRSCICRLQSLRPQWIWVPLNAGRQRTQPPMTIPFIPRMSQDGSIGIVLHNYLSPQARPPHRRLHDDKRGNSALGMSFLQNGGVSQHTWEACGQPLPAKKTPRCSGKTQTLTLLIKFWLRTIRLFLSIVHIYV